MMIIRQLFIMLLGFAMITQAAAQEQVITINTHFRSIDHKPTWLLIVRNLQTGEVIPHLFTMQKKRAKHGIWGEAVLSHYGLKYDFSK